MGLQFGTTKQLARICCNRVGIHPLAAAAIPYDGATFDRKKLKIVCIIRTPTLQCCQMRQRRTLYGTNTQDDRHCNCWWTTDNHSAIKCATVVPMITLDCYCSH